MRSAFEYAIVRVVPHVEREEFVNAGVILFCSKRDLLLVRLALDEARLVALAGEVDLELVRTHLAALESVGRGGAEAGAVGALTPRERFSWLVSPRSTILQTSSPHGGVAEDLDAALEHIVREMVRPPRRSRA